jgi:hypothetical protein
VALRVVVDARRQVEEHAHRAPKVTAMPDGTALRTGSDCSQFV